METCLKTVYLFLITLTVLVVTVVVVGIGNAMGGEDSQEVWEHFMWCVSVNQLMPVVCSIIAG